MPWAAVPWYYAQLTIIPPSTIFSVKTPVDGPAITVIVGVKPVLFQTGERVVRSVYFFYKKAKSTCLFLFARLVGGISTLLLIVHFKS